MKKVKSKFLISLILILGIASSSFASELHKTLQKEFTVSNNSVFVLMNKYGKVDVQNWDQNKVAIEVVITVFICEVTIGVIQHHK